MFNQNDVVNFKGNAALPAYNNTRIVFVDNFNRALIVHPKGISGAAIVHHQLNHKYHYGLVLLADLILSDEESKYPKDLLISMDPVPGPKAEADHSADNNEDHQRQMKSDQKKIDKFLDQVIKRGILKEREDKVFTYTAAPEQEGGEPFVMVFVDRENLANYFYNTPEHLAFLHKIVEVLDQAAENGDNSGSDSVDQAYLDKLAAIKGVGKKRAKAIAIDYPTEKSLVDAIAAGEKKLTPDKDVNKILIAYFK